MVYDNYGNIVSKNGKAYTYDNTWKDLLISYDGQSITYDKQGNPTSYLGHTLTWEKGRQLKSFVNIQYTYNANGIRTSKTVNGVKHTYTLDGTKILKETWDGNTLVPLYDNEDSVCGIIYNNEPYYFQKNLQDDVIGIVDKNAELVAKYSYDAWGECIDTQDSSGVGISTINPFRYRGYYYDEETGFYYVSSRYYDPEIGRFLNSDEVGLMSCFGLSVSYNLFAYCDNTPINMTDPRGYKATKFYSGVVGFGIQILLSANVLCYQGFIGVEGLWFAFTKNNNFGNGIIPWCYWFAGGSMGLTLDFKKILSKNFLNNPKNVLKGFGLGFSVSVYFTFFLITAKRMEGPQDYTRSFTFSSITAWGITVSKASGSNISTYGIGFAWEVGASLKKGISIGKKLFGTAKGGSYYWALPINRNAKELYSLVESKV